MSAGFSQGGGGYAVDIRHDTNCAHRVIGIVASQEGSSLASIMCLNCGILADRPRTWFAAGYIRIVP